MYESKRKGDLEVQGLNEVYYLFMPILKNNY
jgi:hypothetical protein